MSSSINLASSLSSALLSSTTSTSSAGDWINPSGAGQSSWFDNTSSDTNQQAAVINAVSTTFATTAANSFQGQGLLAGQAAYQRVIAAIQAKQAQYAKSSGTSTPAATGSNVENLMQSFDNITINNGSALSNNISSSGAASGYSAVHDLMASFDNITINKPAAGTGVPRVAGGNPLAAVDAVIATPKINVKT
jgi:hypothetical protein